MNWPDSPTYRTIVGSALLVVGVYFNWTYAWVGTHVPYTTLQYSGVYLDRVLLLAPLALLAVVRVRNDRKQVAGVLLIVTGVAAMVVPLIRLMAAINYHAVDFIPAEGFHVTILSSLFFVSAGTTALSTASDDEDIP